MEPEGGNTQTFGYLGSTGRELRKTAPRGKIELRFIVIFGQTGHAQARLLFRPKCQTSFGKAPQYTI